MVDSDSNSTSWFEAGWRSGVAVPGLHPSTGSNRCLGEAHMESETGRSLFHNRRYFLGLGLAAVAGLVCPAARAAIAPARRLAFYHTHTGESLTATYWESG